jgi:predicted HTH transcriptional regulator
MTTEELIQIMDNREGEQVEFKPSLLGRRELAEYAVGLGNSGGGWLFTGISDRPPRRILPFDWPSEDDLQRIRTSIYDSARIRVDFQRVETSDRLRARHASASTPQRNGFPHARRQIPDPSG